MALYFTGSTPLLVTFSCIFLAVYFFVKFLESKKQPHKKYPPSLPSIPFVGSFPFFKDRGNIHRHFAEKAKHLGSVFSCNLASRYTIVLNDRNSIRDTLFKKSLVFADRIANYTNENYLNPEHKGIISSRYDANFKRLHQQFLGIMKVNFGLGQRQMEERVEKQIEELIPRIEEFGGKAFDPTEVVQLATLNVVCTIAFGTRGSQDDPDLKHLRSLIVNMAANDPLHAQHCPILRFLPYYRNLIKTTLFFWNQESQLLTKKVEAILNSGDREKSFVGAYVQKEGPNYDQADLIEITRNLLNAGSETTTFTVLWALILLANHPELQKRVQHEIDSMVPSERLPSISDMANLPLTEATMLEVMRFKTMLPISLIRSTLSDTEINGYHIPKGTAVRANIYAVHMSKDEWGDPENFRPERFLDESGLNVIGRDRIMPFSIGKRSCIAEGIARPEIFLFISSLIQRFQVCPPDTQGKIAGLAKGLTMTKTAPFQMRMIPRKQK